MNANKSAFIAVSFREKEKLRSVITKISSVLITFNIEPIVYVDRQVRGSNTEMMESALAALASSSLLIAETSFKRIGIGLEVGYAAALGKPVIVVRKKDAPSSTTVEGVAQSVIEYEDEQDLEKKLIKALAVI